MASHFFFSDVYADVPKSGCAAWEFETLRRSVRFCSSRSHQHRSLVWPTWDPQPGHMGRVSCIIAEVSEFLDSEASFEEIPQEFSIHRCDMIYIELLKFIEYILVLSLYIILICFNTACNVEANRIARERGLEEAVMFLAQRGTQN